MRRYSSLKALAHEVIICFEASEWNLVKNEMESLETKPSCTPNSEKDDSFCYRDSSRSPLTWRCQSRLHSFPLNEKLMLSGLCYHEHRLWNWVRCWRCHVWTIADLYPYDTLVRTWRLQQSIRFVVYFISFLEYQEENDYAGCRGQKYTTQGRTCPTSYDIRSVEASLVTRMDLAVQVSHIISGMLWFSTRSPQLPTDNR